MAMVCHQCGADLTGRRKGTKYCSKRCCYLHSKATEVRTCGELECERKLYARSLCRTHYNQSFYPNRHRKRAVSCVVCGTTVMRRVDNSRLDSHCCSVECRTIRQFGKLVGTATYTWNSDAKKRALSFGCQVIEDVDRDAVLERDGWRCYLCDKDMRGTDDPFSPDSATVDHVTPLSQGGEHSMRNVRACCLACNCSKADRPALRKVIAAAA